MLPHTFWTIPLVYLVPVSLCYNYSFLYDLLFIHSLASTGFPETRLFEVLEHPFISISKNIAVMNILGNFPVKSFISRY